MPPPDHGANTQQDKRYEHGYDEIMVSLVSGNVSPNSHNLNGFVQILSAVLQYCSDANVTYLIDEYVVKFNWC